MNNEYKINFSIKILIFHLQIIDILQYKTCITLRDKTMDDKLMYILNDDT